MADPFEKYLGTPDPATAPAEAADPFAAYIGPATSQEKQKPVDPFAQYLGPAPSSVDEEIEKRSFFDRPVLGAEYTKRGEIEQIAKKHGVDAAELESLAPYFGARMEGSDFFSESEAKRVAGGLGSIALSIPQKLYKKYRGGPMEAALDDLQNLSAGRQSYTQLIGESAIPGVGVAGKVGSTAGRIAAGAATGAVAGYSGSSREQEGLGTVFGAVVGGAASALAAKLAARNAPEAEREVAQRVLQREGAKLDEATEEILQKRAASERDIQKLIAGEAELDESSANRIVQEQYEPDFVQKVLDPGTEEGRLYREAVGKESPKLVESQGFSKAIEQKLARDAVERRAIDFASELTEGKPKTLEEAREAITEYASRQGGEEAVQQRYKLFTEQEAAIEYIVRNVIRGGRGDNFQDRALNTLSDAQFVLRDIDQRMGTSLESVHRRMNAAYNKMSYARNEARKQLDDIFVRNKAIDSTIVDTDKIYRALDSGSMEGLSSAEQKAVGDFRQFFDNSLEYVNKLVRSRDPDIVPLSIPKRANYVPHMLLETPDLIRKVDQRVSEVLDLAEKMFGRKVDDISGLTQQEFRQLAASRPMAELIEGVQTLNSQKVTNAVDLSARLKDAFNSRSGRLELETTARAALERQGQIPDWMREKNLYKLADRWSTNTLKHLYLRRDMDAMRSIAKRLKTARADLEVSYVENLLGDLNGIRKGTLAEKTRQYGIAYQQKIDQLAERANGPVARGAIAVAKAIPTILSDINKQVYPNLLGLSPRALLTNATQTFSKTAPELGTRYGHSAIIRGAIDAALNWKTMGARLERQGFTPAEFVQKYRRAVSDGIRRGSLYSIPSETLSAMGNAAMFFYTKMDTINRAIATGTADIMAADLAKGSKLASESLRKFPLTVQKQVARAGTEQEVADILASHLNASTQYNYNRASMSEYGRTMGPLFSTFSKWPTATLGEMLQEYRQRGLVKGTMRNAEKFAAPLLLFQAADYLLYGDDPEQMSDRQKLILGKAGLSQAAPIGALGGIIRGDFFTPPAVDAVTQALVVPALEGDESKLQRGLSSAIQNFTPGSVYVRVLTDDLPTLITGERPEGDTFVGRTTEAVRKLAK